MIPKNFLQALIVNTYNECFTSKNIFDAGCGDGNFEDLMSKKEIDCNITGVDIKKDAIADLKGTFPQYSFLTCSLSTRLPFKSGGFDTVVMFDVIEHVPSGSETDVLTELRRILKEGGHLIITTPHNTPLNFLDPAWYFGHRHYSTNKLSSIVESAGFTVKEVRMVGDLWWELDTILFYVCKHIFRREYSNPLRVRFSTTDCFRSRGTRLCLVAQTTHHA